jgi:hypothetical protein
VQELINILAAGYVKKCGSGANNRRDIPFLRSAVYSSETPLIPWNLSDMNISQF